MIHISSLKKLKLRDKSVFVALMSIFGIGKFSSKKICIRMGFHKKKNMATVTPEELKEIVRIINKRFIVDVDLKLQNYMIKKEILEMNNYRGIRMSYGLPVNGQRTHTNAQTARRLKNKDTVRESSYLE
jgi:small subunit ribosomal protein S13